jgi:hypothetical protein
MDQTDLSVHASSLRRKGDMKLNVKVLLIALVLGLTLIVPSLCADEYNIADYEFIWNLATVDSVDVKIQKVPSRLGVLLSGRGGKMGMVFLTAPRAKAIGEVLLKTEEYYRKHHRSYEKQPKGFEKDIVDTVPAGGHKVVFAFRAKIKGFEVRIMQPKLISPIVLLTREGAPIIGGYLVDAEKLVEMVDQRVQP